MMKNTLKQAVEDLLDGAQLPVSFDGPSAFRVESNADNPSGNRAG